VPRAAHRPKEPFLGAKETPEALIYLTHSVNCFEHVFIDAGEGIAPALVHGERDRDKLARADAMSVIGARAENICSQRAFRLLTQSGRRGPPPVA
jgi:hypothetical protein